MAQKKAVVAPASGALEEKVVGTSGESKENTSKEKESTVVKENPEVENPEVEKPEGISQQTVAVEELPDYAKRVLKLYDTEPELYVTPKGGVFTKGTDPSVRGAAILFKNPFYKKS